MAEQDLVQITGPSPGLAGVDRSLCSRAPAREGADTWVGWGWAEPGSQSPSPVRTHNLPSGMGPLGK